MPKSRIRSAAALSLMVLVVFLCIIQFSTMVFSIAIASVVRLDDLVFSALGLTLYYAFLRHKSNQIKLICVLDTIKRKSLVLTHAAQKRNGSSAFPRAA